MEVGIGVDVVEVARMERFLATAEHHAAGVFTRQELESCAALHRRAEHLAARFAAKEAVLKAIGTGLGARMRWTDVEVLHDVSGRPKARLHGEVAAAAARRGLGEVTISLSHSAGVAIASAIAVPNPVPAAA
jgi:holo-[acyl-carrier protein] synthase